MRIQINSNACHTKCLLISKSDPLRSLFLSLRNRGLRGSKYQLIKKFPIVYGTVRFITPKSTPLHPIHNPFNSFDILTFCHFRYILILPSNLHLGLSVVSSFRRFPKTFYMHFYHSQDCYVSRQ